MDAIEFIRERNRMCKSFGASCNNCPADKNASCDSFAWKEELIPIVEKWSKENPRKTRQSIFLEQYPNASVVGDTGTPCVYPCYIEQGMKDANYCKSLSCYDCRREFWMQEVE